MKKTLTLLTFAISLQAATAQEPLSREETLRYAFLASLDLARLTDTPLPTDVDVKRAVAMRHGDYGAMVLPEAKLDSETLGALGRNTLPLGQLWLHELAPMRDYSPVPVGELRLAEVTHDGGTASVPQCTLAARRSASGSLELALLGKTTQPLLTVPLKAVDPRPQQQPIEMAASRVDAYSGQITLRIVGRYEASVPVTELQRY
ncbi:MAG: hypothetical protein JXQ71_17850 [Verrucomicrobia bacterium]|nr:hypothetical protein [Verrucomicrobiota bacterium]